VLALATQACASVVSDDKSTTYIETDPENARCELHGQDFKRVINTPNSINLPAEAAPITIACKAPGYATTTEPLDTKIDGWIFGNILLGGGIGILIDLARGAGQKYPPRVTVILQPETFASTSARDEWFDSRRTTIEKFWEKQIAAASNCSGATESNTGASCGSAIAEAKTRRDEEIKQLEEKRMRARVSARGT
jgi:hypothetical protein